VSPVGLDVTVMLTVWLCPAESTTFTTSVLPLVAPDVYVVVAPVVGPIVGVADVDVVIDQVYGAVPPCTVSVALFDGLIDSEAGKIVSAPDAADTVTLAVAVDPAKSVTVTTSVPASVPAVYAPAAVIVPPDAFVVSDHVYGAVPLEAVNVCVPDVLSAADGGEIAGFESADSTCCVRSGAGADPEVEGGVPPHAATAKHTRSRQIRAA